MHPVRRDALLLLGRIAQRRGDVAAAAEAFRAVLASDPADELATALLARVE